jgi:multidrug transporter EmrE-like cation transporter
VLITLVGRAVFGEKLSRRQFVAMGVILLSLVLLNV